MHLSSPTSNVPLQPDLAFVVQIQVGSHNAPETLAGRVEHVASGEFTRFATPEELFAFFERTALDITGPRT